MNVHIHDRLFLRLSVQQVQLRHQLYFGGCGPACGALVLLTCSSRGGETEGDCLVSRCGGRSWCVWMSVCSGAECEVLQGCLRLLLSSSEAAGFLCLSLSGLSWAVEEEEQMVLLGWAKLSLLYFCRVTPCSVGENGNICRVRYHLLVIKELESSLILIFI